MRPYNAGTGDGGIGELKMENAEAAGGGWRSPIAYREDDRHAIPQTLAGEPPVAPRRGNPQSAGAYCHIGFLTSPMLVVWPGKKTTSSSAGPSG